MQDLENNDRVELTRTIIHILDGWEIDASDQITILDLPEKTPARAMRRYRENTPLPDDSNIMERIVHVLGIAEALRTTFPRNNKMGAHWLRKPHRRFNQQTPLSVILKDGLNGLISVRADVDCTFSWSKSE